MSRRQGQSPAVVLRWAMDEQEAGTEPCCSTVVLRWAMGEQEAGTEPCCSTVVLRWAVGEQEGRRQGQSPAVVL